jgi:hypothetical protein
MKPTKKKAAKIAAKPRADDPPKSIRRNNGDDGATASQG